VSEIAWSVSSFVVAAFALGLVVIGAARLARPDLVDYRQLWRAYAQEFLIVALLLIPLIVGGWFFLLVLFLFAGRALYELVILFAGHDQPGVAARTLAVFVPFVALPLCVAALLRFHFEWPLVLFVYVVVEINDAAAYVIGKLFGKKHILPKLSPGKTQAGLLAGLCAGLAAGLLYGVFVLHVNNGFLIFALSTLVLFGGLLGDLFTSYVKRQENAKDFRSLIPGQGGILDIFDAFLGGTLMLGLAVGVLAATGVLS
jgi:CDP-diglyceride synthetase